MKCVVFIYDDGAVSAARHADPGHARTLPVRWLTRSSGMDRTRESWLCSQSAANPSLQKSLKSSE